MDGVVRVGTLRLAQAAGINRHESIAPSVVTLLESAKQPHRRMAAGIPAFQGARARTHAGICI